MSSCTNDFGDLFSQIVKIFSRIQLFSAFDAVNLTFVKASGL